jgi:hypothetical protein
MKLYVCKRIRLLNHLTSKGFQFIKTERDRTNPNYNVWIFIETPELRNAIEEYYSSI